MRFSQELAEFCARVRRAPVEVTLRELIDLFAPQEGDDPRLLGRLKSLQPALDFVMLEVIPPIDDGDFESRRLIVQRQVADAAEHQLRAEIAKDEDEVLEKKSSFSCCIKTLRAKADLQPKQYRKSDVEESSCMRLRV